MTMEKPSVRESKNINKTVKSNKEKENKSEEKEERVHKEVKDKPEVKVVNSNHRKVALQQEEEKQHGVKNRFW